MRKIHFFVLLVIPSLFSMERLYVQHESDPLVVIDIDQISKENVWHKLETAIIQSKLLDKQ